MAIIFKYKIIKINIYPFGGYTIFETSINNPFIKEFMVFIGGILFQTIFFLTIKFFLDNSSYTFKIIEHYNISILLFNLLPIIPLDGSKVINILLNKIFPFKLSHLISIYISYISILIIILNSVNNFSYLIMVIILLFILIKEHKKHQYLFNMFLIERYIKELRFNKNNFIKKLDLKYMKKYKNNIFILDKKYIDEKEMLLNKFN